MNYTITDEDAIWIKIDDSFINFLVPKFRLLMVVEEPYLTLYWEVSEQGKGVRILKIDFNDVTTPVCTSAADLMSIIEGYQISGFSGGTTPPLTAKGDLLTHDGSAEDILSVGADGRILLTDSTKTDGIYWADPSILGFQPADADLTEIAGLTPSNDDIIQRKAGVWTNRTPSQYKSDLSLTKSDVGLSNVDNVQQQPIDSDLTDIAALTPSNDDFIQRKSGVWVNRSIAQVKADLSLSGTNSGDITVSGQGAQLSGQALTITEYGVLTFTTGASLSTLSRNSSFFFGQSGALQPNTASGRFKIYNRTGKTLTIVACNAQIFLQTTGTSENATLYIRLNNTTDTSIDAAIAGNVQLYDIDKTGLSISWTNGSYIELKIVTPNYVTQPQNFASWGTISYTV